MRQSYIYVLHLEEPICHARHYSGCTSNIKRRLERHASGNGGNLIRVAMERGIHWQLGGLSICTFARMRQLERKLKDIANGPKYCGICCGEPARLEGTIPVDLQLVRFAKSSRELRGAAVESGVSIRTVKDTDSPKIKAEIIQLMKHDRDALGFIPVGEEGGIDRLLKFQRAIVAYNEKEQTVGYALWTVNLAADRTKIHQMCVMDEYRLSGIGRMMVEAIEAKEKLAMECAVREDLAANMFWPAVGFKQIGERRHATSGSLLNLYRKDRSDGMVQSV